MENQFLVVIFFKHGLVTLKEKKTKTKICHLKNTDKTTKCDYTS